MKIAFSFVLLLLMSIARVAAQGISVEVMLDQEQFLSGETLFAKVRVTNFSGRTLNLGKDENWLTFVVEDNNGHPVEKKAPPAVLGEFDLESSSVATRKVDLSACFNLSKPGRYSIIATVRVPEILEMASNRKKAIFDIISGNKIWELSFGVPQPGDANNERPEIRKYALVQTSHQKQLKLYMRLTDAAEREVFRVFPLGPIVSFGDPQAQLDKFSNLHVLYQIGARSFLYTLVNPDGFVIARETYDHNGSKPRLRSSDDGRIMMAGGVRRFTANDVPPPSTPTASNDARSDQP